MSTAPVEVAEEALEKKVEAMKIVDGNNMEVKKGTTTTDGKSERRERRFARMTDEERRRIWEEEQMTKKPTDSFKTSVEMLVQQVAGARKFAYRIHGLIERFEAD